MRDLQPTWWSLWDLKSVSGFIQLTQNHPLPSLRGRRHGVKFLLHCLVFMWYWTSYLTSLSSSCQVCKIEEISIHNTVLWNAYRRVWIGKTSINCKPLHKWEEVFLPGVPPLPWTPLNVVSAHNLLLGLLWSGMRCLSNTTIAFLNLMKPPLSFYL